MQDFKHKYKKLYKQYCKSLWTNHKDSLNSSGHFLDYFVNYLKFMRDYYILTLPDEIENEEERLKIAALITAVAEYENFNSCVSKYFKPDGEVLEQLAKEKREDIQEKYNQEKAYHWTNFWQLVMLNIEGWKINA